MMPACQTERLQTGGQAEGENADDQRQAVHTADQIIKENLDGADDGDHDGNVAQFFLMTWQSKRHQERSRKVNDD